MLKTGKSVPEAVVATTMVALRQLLADDSNMFWNFVRLCEDSSHRACGEYHILEIDFSDALKKSSLLTPDGHVNNYVREIALAAAKAEGHEDSFSVSSPFAE